MIAALRSIFVTSPFILVSTIFFGTISLVLSFFDKTGDRPHEVAQVWARSLLRVAGVRVEVKGLEKLVPGRPCVLASNHTSYFDTPVIVACVPLQFRFFAKEELFGIPFLGTHLKRTGHFPVVLGDARAGVKSMIEGARWIRDHKISVLVFPEGGRALDSLEEFKEGAAFVAIKAGVPVYPVGLTGVREVLRMHTKIVHAGRVSLEIGDPIDTSAMTVRDRGALTQTLLEKISQMTGEPMPRREQAASEEPAGAA